MVGVLVLLIAVPAAPEKPAVLAVLNNPLMIAEPAVTANVIILVPAFMVDPAATVNVLVEAKPMLKLLVENKLPVFTFPTEIFPETFVVVIAALKVAPPALVLLMVKFS